MNPYGTAFVRDCVYMAQQDGRIPGSVPCTGSSAASAAHCFPPRARDVRTGAQLNSWCSLRATSSSVSSLGSPESSDDAGTELEVVCLGLGEGFTREGLGVGGFDRGLGLSHRSEPSSDAVDCTRAVFDVDLDLNRARGSATDGWVHLALAVTKTSVRTYIDGEA